MKYRAAKRHQRAAFGHDRCGYSYVTIRTHVAPFRSEIAAAIARMHDTVRKVTESQAPPLRYIP
ncbi:hypothetical protein ACJEDT_12965 [Rhodococcoides fascians]|uniref:hypothetical protein n=1 Tax=Rhodococcoides fascians TaxID=1828 RepID=UPI00389AA85C